MRKAYISLLKEIKLGGPPSSQRAGRAEGAISTSSSLMPKTVHSPMLPEIRKHSLSRRCMCVSRTCSHSSAQLEV